LSHPDWQAFEEGSLSAEERHRALRLLREDPSAREEWEGFQAFRQTLRERGLREPVPENGLERALRRAARPSNKTRFALWPALAAAIGGAVLAVLWVRHDPMAFALTPTQAILQTSEVEAAARWIADKTGFPAPDVRLPKEASLFAARQGRDNVWACVDFAYDGKTFYLYMNPHGRQLGDEPTRFLNGRAFYEGQGIGWRTPGLAYYLKGGSREQRWALSSHLASVMPSPNG
jgi:hypothetical protein